MDDRYGTVWRRNRRGRLMNIRAELMEIASDFERERYRGEWVKSFREWSKDIAEVVRSMGVADPGPDVDRTPTF